MWRRKSKVEKEGKAYTELAVANKIQEDMNVIISKYKSGGYTLAQQVVLERGGRRLSLFIKGAMHIDSLEGLYALRDALNEAINQEEKPAIGKS
jgi:hypothetical protein